MQAYSMEYIQSEIHWQIQERAFRHKLSSITKEIIQLNPRLLLGESNLFDYDPINHYLILTPPFQTLLTLLVQLGELDDKALTANSLYELNSILQQPQWIQGGLLRKEGTERWQLEDNPIKQKYRQILDILLQRLGFVFPKILDGEMTVNHCIIFGARA